MTDQKFFPSNATISMAAEIIAFEVKADNLSITSPEQPKWGSSGTPAKLWLCYQAATTLSFTSTKYKYRPNKF